MRSQHFFPDLETSLPEPLAAEGLSERLTRSINGRTGGHVRNLRVEVTEAGIVLSGTAPTYYAKQLATHAAFDEVTGLNVENAIDVL